MKQSDRFSLFARSLAAVSLCLFCAAAFAAGEDPFKLRPPHDELQPSFWQLHGSWIIAVAVLALVVLALFIAWLMRPKPEEITPPEILARRELEALRGRAEDAALVVEVTQILRRYILLAFGLAPDELTTTEIRQTLQHSAPVGPELAAAITEFLRECDERKFAPTPPPPQTGVVDRALRLLEQVEASRRHPSQSAPPVTGSGPISSAAS
jgi:hypothetical protein